MLRTVDGYEIYDKNIKIKNINGIENKDITEVNLNDYIAIFFKENITVSNTNILTIKEIIAYLFINFNSTIKGNSIFIFQSIKNKKTDILKKELNEELFNYKEDLSDKNNKISFNLKEDFFKKIQSIKEEDFLKNKENAINLIYCLLKIFSYEKDQNIVINYDKKIIRFIQNIFLHFKIKTTRSKETLVISDKQTILKTINIFDINNDLNFRALASYLEQKYLLIASNNIFFYSKINFKQG